MTIPVMPTSASNFAQGLRDALLMYVQRRDMAKQQALEAERRQRGDDIQNMQIWQQILPGLSSMKPAQELPNPALGMVGGTLNLPEQVNTPAPPSAIAQSLQRLTGQGQMGLSPEQLESMRKNAIGAFTAKDQMALPGLQVQAAKQSLVGGALGNQKLANEVETGPSIDAQKYIAGEAPGMVNDVISRLKLTPTEGNISKIVDAAWAQFQTGNAPGVIKRSANKEMFGQAVRAIINQNREFDLEGRRIAKMGETGANSPANELYKALQSVNAELGILENETQTMIGQYPDIRYGIATGPNSEAVVKKFKALEQRKADYRLRQSQLNNRYGELVAPGVTPLPTGAMSGVGEQTIQGSASQVVGGTAAQVANYEKTLKENPALRTRIAKEAYIRARMAEGLSPQEAQALAAKFGIRLGGTQ